MKWTLYISALKGSLDTLGFLLLPCCFFHPQIPDHPSSKTVVGFLFFVFLHAVLLPSLHKVEKDSLFSQKYICLSVNNICFPNYKEIEESPGTLENPKALEDLGSVLLTPWFSSQPLRPSSELSNQFSSPFSFFKL